MFVLLPLTFPSCSWYFAGNVLQHDWHSSWSAWFLWESSECWWGECLVHIPSSWRHVEQRLLIMCKYQYAVSVDCIWWAYPWHKKQPYNTTQSLTACLYAFPKFKIATSQQSANVWPKLKVFQFFIWNGHLLMAMQTLAKGFSHSSNYFTFLTFELWFVLPMQKLHALIVQNTLIIHIPDSYCISYRLAQMFDAAKFLRME